MPLTLKLPALSDMPFRAAMMADPDTMAYNKGYPAFDGYDPATGCIAFPEDAWASWLADWTDHAPERYFAFLVDEEGQLVGEVNWHEQGRRMGIIVASSARGKGYGMQGLRLLAAEAFRFGEIDQLVNEFEETRDAALGAHLAAGFVPVSGAGDLLRLRLTRERYEARHRAELLRLCMDAMCDFDAGDALLIHHFAKVHDFARQIGLAEGLEDNALFTLEAAAIVHDIGIRPAMARYGSCEGPLQEKLGPPEAEEMLIALGFPMAVVRRGCFLVGHHHTVQNVAGADWQILLEADFLVNMVENQLSDAAVDSAADKLFRTAAGKRLLRWIHP